MKEIIYFTLGDSNNASLWSNVPYLMAKHFEQNGIVVNRVNIKLHQTVVVWAGRFLRLLPKSFVGNDYTANQSPLARIYANWKIRKAIKK
jgi:hypothetical protein